MGRIFEKRKDRMFARWSKTAKAFTKMGKEIAIAIKLGSPDPDGNPRLRMAIQTARALNMPKDRIEAAIHRASSKENASLQEIVYAGYAPHGVALFIEAATDNPTRTVANIRSLLSSHNGSLATSGALDFLFRRQGVFKIKAKDVDVDELELALIDHGLEELEHDEEEILVYVDFSNFGTMQRALEDRKLEVVTAGSQRVPASFIQVTEDQAKEIHELLEDIEEDDDVQHVFHNMEES
jgi:YebC/PmpR family DNA-binding regulatory protein